MLLSNSWQGHKNLPKDLNRYGEMLCSDRVYFHFRGERLLSTPVTFPVRNDEREHSSCQSEEMRSNSELMLLQSGQSQYIYLCVGVP